MAASALAGSFPRQLLIPVQCPLPRLFTLGSGSMPIAEHLYSVPEIALPKFQMQKALSSSPEFLRTGVSELFDELIKDL